MNKSRKNSDLFDDDLTCIDVKVGDKAISIDKRKDSLIISDECKRIMRNLCTDQSVNWGTFDMNDGKVTQPVFLSAEDRILFFKTKMFYLLQERHFVRQNKVRSTLSGRRGSTVAVIAEAYPAFLSPFSEVTDQQLPENRIHGSKKRSTLAAADLLRSEGKRVTSSGSFQQKVPVKMLAQQAGMSSFIESIYKADHSVMRLLEEKVLKTVEKTGYAAFFKDQIKRMDVLMSIFPDYQQLMNDGKNEESKLNSLVNHVRTRIKFFDKLQMFYENPSIHDGHVFAIPNTEVTEVNEDLAGLRHKEMHLLDEKKMQKLYSIFHDDYRTAKTTLIADGTQPVVVNLKKLDRVKRYVDECNDYKGKVLIPYVAEMNFFGLTVPWKRMKESVSSADQTD